MVNRSGDSLTLTTCRRYHDYRRNVGFDRNPSEIEAHGDWMKLVSVQVFSDASNQAVVQMPGRKFPGSVVQGDSLAALVRGAQAVHELAVQTGHEELIGESELMLDNLKERLEFYECVLAEHGLDKPY